MMKFYIYKDQLYNFLILKEPVELISGVQDEKYFEVIIPTKKLIFESYNTYTTVEIKSFRKAWKRLWRKILKRKK